MVERFVFFIHKLRFIPVVLLITASLFLLFFFLLNLGPRRVEAFSAGTSNTSSTSDPLSAPNVITSSMTEAAGTVGRTVNTAADKSARGLRTFASATTRGGKTIARGTFTGLSVTARFAGRNIALAANAVGNAIVFMFQLPIKAVGLITNAPAMNTVIKPAEHNQVPIINPDSPELLAARVALPAVQTVTQTPAQTIPEISTESVWPMHGQITTHFGEPGRLYNPLHTGLDISDNQRSGVTPVHSFRQGRVIETSRFGGLGNHVIVDHGSGVTSVYAHLSTINVVVGQDVNPSTVLGYQGTTGVSTGTHLHFEIRVNGQAADPHLFINGQP